jgi:NADH-quinone oxidoreductase subunit M
VLGALYMMWAYERVMWGPITKKVNQTITDLTKREIAVMAPLITLILLMGLYPRPLLSRIEPSLTLLLNRVGAAQARLDAEHTRALAALAAPLRTVADK